ncbi:Toll6p [Blomia tropicalis]|nr:Toll6p [Blomia tropicalis]
MTEPKMKLSLSDQSSAKMYDPMMRLIPSISSSNHHDHNQTYPYTCLVTTNIENYRRRRPNTNDDSSIDSSTCYHQRSSSSKPMTKTKTVISIDHHNQRYCHHDRSPTSKRTRRRESWSSTSSTSIFSSRKRIGRIAMLTFVTCLMLFHDIVIQPLTFVNALTEDVNNGTIRRRRDDSHSFVHYPLPPPAAFSQSYVAPAGCEWRARSASSHLFGNMVSSSSSSSSTSSSSITSTEPSSPNEMLLTCRLRTLNGALDSGANLSLIPSDRTAGLALICDDLLFESSLPNRSFERLHQLRELHIDQCKLSELAPELLYGLIELRQLTIRTRNTEWGDLSLRIPANLFHTVRLLEQLDLSENGIQQLPSSLFCPMSRLQFVNVSSNSIGDVASFGFSAKSSSSSSNNHDQSSSSVISNMNGECRRLDSIIHLDASSNRIKVLTDRGFGRLQRLQILTLRHNLIVRAEETSLAGLNELSRLDLSNNQLVALPARFFQAVKLSLAELYMQNNSISVIPPGLFSGLSQVTILDLAHNEVTSHWIGPNTFADMTRLMSLDLSYNKLTRIDSTAFRGLFTLQSLSLQHNDIESLAENAFAANRNLHTLSLSGNRLTSLDAASFAGLEVLNALALDFNRILHVHPLSFANISGLIELNLAGNRLEAIPIAIGSLHMIRSLDLSYNRIRDIGNASYQGLEQLYSLNLEGNQIGNLTRGDFEDLPSLRVLNMAHNRIGSVEVGTFEDIIDLHALRLDSNSIEYINSLFPSLAHLMMLNISANRIEQFDYAMIPFALIWLDIHSNRIETLGNFYAVESELKLRTLDASGNRIGEIEDASLPNSIELVLLNRNAIRKIAPHTFAKKTNLTRVDLSENRLTSLDLNSLRLAPIQERRPLPEFSIAGNPFLCDCNMEWLQRAAITSRTTTTINDDPHQQQQQQQQLQQQPNSRLYPRVVDAHMVNCRLPFGRISGQMDRSNGSSQSSLMTPIVSLRSNQFLCSYRSHCFTLCHCCEFDACDCEMTCPDNCSCFYDQSWSTNIVDCGVNNHLVVPARIPMDVTDLYLDGNDISELSPHTFIGRKNLRHLHLNSSHIRSINNRTFNGLKSLLVLNLADNELDQLYGYEFERLSDLRELYLQSNRLTSIHNRTFSALRSLKVLRLDHNRIIEFELWTGLAHAVHLTDLYVGYNDWSCECHFVGNMIEWLPMRSDIVRDLSAVHCRYNETYSLPLAIMDHHQASSFNSDSFESIESARANISAACSHYAKRESIAAQSTIVLGTNGILTTSSSTSSEISSAGLMPPFSVPVIVLVIASTFGILILLASIVTAVLYRHELSVWFYARTGIRLGSRHHRSGHSGSSGRGGRRKGGKGRNRRGRDYVGDDHDEKLFDAFVSYSKKDEAFVQQLLAPELEVGSTPMRLCLHYRDLPVASGFVADAIVEAMAASRRTILVISEHFLRGEWTHYEFKTAHQEALRSRARHKLILIFVGPVAGKDLDPDIRVWLKTAGNTCLQWGEKMFWEKLRYALPEIPASATSTSSGTGSSSSNSSTTSSSYGRKISSGGGGNGGGGGILTTLSKGGTLPALSSLTSQSPLTMSRNAIDSYGHHGHLQHIPPSAAHHPLLAQHHQQQHLTLGRTTMAHPYNLYQQQQQQQQSQSALYSPSSIHSQQSTYAYPTYHPPGNLLNDHHRASSHQSTPPPLPPAHPLQQHLQQQQQQQQQQMTVPAPNQPPPPIPHLTGTGLYHLDQHHNVGHHQQQQQHHHHHRGGGLNSSSNESSLITNSTTMSNASHNGSIDSDRHSSNHGQTGQPGQPVTPFVPSATSTTAVAVHI